MRPFLLASNPVSPRGGESPTQELVAEVSRLPKVASEKLEAGLPPHNQAVMTQWERMVAGELYRAMDPELMAARERARLLCARINDMGPGDAERRTALEQLLGA